MAADSLSTSPRGVLSLIDHVVLAYGGRAALESVHAYRMEGRVFAVQQKREGPTSRLFQRPGRLRVELHYPDRAETRIVSGESGWRGLGAEVLTANGPMLDAMILQAARADLPWFLLQHASDAHAIEPLDHDGHSIVGVEVPLERGLSIRAYVDTTSGRIEVSQGRMVREGGGETVFQTDYSDFRKVGRVVFAFHEENFASGQPTGTTTFDRVGLNPKLVPADFGAPAGAGNGADSLH
ncbi:MAG TPA: hypothetical protein VI504_03520 [Candidatus Eisenbacteria bacterium]